MPARTMDPLWSLLLIPAAIMVATLSLASYILRGRGKRGKQLAFAFSIAAECLWIGWFILALKSWRVDGMLAVSLLFLALCVGAVYLEVGWIEDIAEAGRTRESMRIQERGTAELTDEERRRQRLAFYVFATGVVLALALGWFAWVSP